MLASNIAAMIIGSQVTDSFMIKLLGQSYAIDYTTGHIITSTKSADDPWNNNTTIISLGYLICMMISIPFGYLNLDENMKFQWFSFICLIFFTLVFIYQFIINAFYTINDEHPLGTYLTPLYTNSIGQMHLGIIVFAYCYVITIPSWLNEKKKVLMLRKLFGYQLL